MTVRRVYLTAVAGAVSIAAWAAGPAHADWPIYGRDLANTRDAGADGPAVAQVPTMKQAWRFDSPTGDFTGTPVVADGTIVAGDYGGTVYALNAVTGKVRWKRSVGDPVDASAAIDVNAPGGATAFVPVAKSGAPKIEALSLRDGHVRWSRTLTDQPTSSAYGSPTFWRGTLYMGTSGPNGDASTARGAVVALAESSGAVRWRTYTVPPGHDGGAVWSTPAIDTATGRLFVGAGNAYHAPAADTTDAMLALDTQTGAILGHYQATGGDSFSSDNPAGADADFGASANLFTGPDGRALVGEGAKDANYYALDRSTMQFVWKTAVGPASQLGGFIGSTVFDGTHIYGTNALTSQVAALDRDGSIGWTSADGGSLDFAPLALANRILYTVSPGGFLVLRDAASGTVLTRLALNAPSLGGIATTGGAVYVAVGTGPPPGTTSDSNGSIVAFGDTSHSGGAPGGVAGGGGGGSAAVTRHPRIRLRVKPRRVAAGRRVTFRFRARAGGKPLRGVKVRFSGHRGRTGRRGIARIRARLSPGRHSARATKRGYRRGSASVHASRR